MSERHPVTEEMLRDKIVEKTVFAAYGKEFHRSLCVVVRLHNYSICYRVYKDGEIVLSTTDASEAVSSYNAIS